MKPADILKLMVCIAIPLAVGGITGYFAIQNIPGWYNTLNSPAFKPSNALLGPVLTLLYIGMGIGCYLIWKKPDSPERSNALWMYALQLFVNDAWGLVFFYFRQIHIAVIVITLLWILILFMIGSFKKLSNLAAYIQIPYLLWISFATILNIAIWQLN